MFGLSFWEIGIILAIALIVLGPSKLPDLAKSFGKALREFRKATEDFKSTMDDEMYRPDPPQTKLPAESIARPLPPPATTGDVAAAATAAAQASASADPAHAMGAPPAAEAEIVPPAAPGVPEKKV